MTQKQNKTTGLSKQFRSETIEIYRSQIIPAPYNPRKISSESRKTLKRGIDKFGIVGGLVWNKSTGHLVGGHQKLDLLDEANKYDGTPETDYRLKAETVELSLKEEMELNILLNNPNAQGEWNYDMLREIVPDIDYKVAGLTAEDLSIIGVDYTFQTDEEVDLADALNDVMQPLIQTKEEAKALVKAEKERIKNDAIAKAQNMKAYVVISFDTYNAKYLFMRRFGYNPDSEFLKGEDFEDKVEYVG